MLELFIYNTFSGKGISDKKLNNIINYLKLSYPKIVLCKTKQKGDAKAFTLQYIKDTHLIFVLGGDGTIHDIVSAITETNKSPTICVIPNGTMNDLAHTLHIPNNYKKAIDLTKIKKPKECSILKVNNHYAIYACAIGRFSSTSYNTPQSSKKFCGKLSYFCYALKELKTYPPIPAKITIGNTIITTKFSLILMCLGAYVAGFPINRPPNDIVAKMVIITDKTNSQKGSFASVISIGKLFMFGIAKSDKDKLTTTIDFTKATIELTKPYPMVLDGEKYMSDRYEITLLPKRIKFVCNN